jgi:hypothetical protein
MMQLRSEVFQVQVSASHKIALFLCHTLNLEAQRYKKTAVSKTDQESKHPFKNDINL